MLSAGKRKLALVGVAACIASIGLAWVVVRRPAAIPVYAIPMLPSPRSQKMSAWERACIKAANDADHGHQDGMYCYNESRNTCLYSGSVEGFGQQPRRFVVRDLLAKRDLATYVYSDDLSLHKFLKEEEQLLQFTPCHRFLYVL
jgi:hypothetical protein